MRCASLLIPRTTMRPVRYDAEVRGGNLAEKRSAGLEHAEEAWDEWEIHFLILVSLSLQVFLCLTADLRKRSASRVLSTLLWLAYLSADTVAVFVLGHLAVHAQGHKHELMLLWAPFVLVHLGGQDTITAFSKQDNELWMRHMLGLVTQTAVAGYVVSKSSWPDARLRAAMVLMFLCGFLKYSGRTYCLYSASPNNLRASSMDSLWDTVSRLRSVDRQMLGISTIVEERFIVMFNADKCREFIKENTLITMRVDDIILVDAPVDDLDIAKAADQLPELLNEFKNGPDRCIAYQYVAASLTQSYQWLYTKAPLLGLLLKFVENLVGKLPPSLLLYLIIPTYELFHALFQCISTVIALVLFVSAEKEGHYSKADTTVSYILLVGAIVLDLLPTFVSIVSNARKPFRPEAVVECLEIFIASCMQPPGWRTIKQWSEELAQYSMTRRYSTSVEGYKGCMPFIRKWILKCKPLVGDWCVEFVDLARTPVTHDLKLLVLDRLLLLVTRREEWDFASFRGERALGKWMDSNLVSEPERPGYATLHKTLSSRVEFPTSVLIWHIATEICYFSEDKGHDDIQNDETRTTIRKRKERSRELSQYIMYLVFKCDVLLTTNSRLLHYKAHERLTEILLDQSTAPNLDEKKAAIKVFDAMKKQKQKQGKTQGIAQDKKNNEEPGNKDVAPTSTTSSGSGTQEVLQSTEEVLQGMEEVLSRAVAVAQELIDIDDEARRWQLISEVWLEMLFYTAPRCGPDFHYEHLRTGGEFISHVLILMRSLGPFMPKSGA